MNQLKNIKYLYIALHFQLIRIKNFGLQTRNKNGDEQILVRMQLMKMFLQSEKIRFVRKREKKRKREKEKKRKREKEKKRKRKNATKSKN